MEVVRVKYKSWCISYDFIACSSCAPMKSFVILLTLGCLSWCSEGQQINIRNKKCTFPFTYKGQTFYYCTKFDNDKYWCGMDAVYKDKRYADCLPSSCTFPFTYKGETYETCTKAGGSEYWCSHDKEYKGKYSNCEGFMGPYEAKKEGEDKVKIVCVDSNKNPHQVGEKWTDKCTTFECTKNGGKVVDTKCQGQRGCYDVGAKNYACMSKGKTYDSCMCLSKEGKVYNVAVVDDDGEADEPRRPQGCRELDMVHIPGSQWTINCVTRRCNEDGTISVVQAKCLGKNGCQSSGQSGYPCIENGKLYKICTCSGRNPDVKNLVDEDSLYVEEEEVFCKSQDGRKYKLGQKWTVDCAQYACEKGGEAKFISAKCQDREGQCVDIGTTNYKCLYKGRKYDDCSCKGDSKNPYSEGTIPEDAKDVKKTQVKMCFDTQGNMATRWKDGCTEFACVNGESKVVKQKCRDDADKCYDLDTKDFPCVMDKKVWKKCSCELTADGPSLNAAMG